MTDDLSDQIDTTVPPSGPGCKECTEDGGWWFHLRRCAACGHIGCCDASPAQHGRRHWEQTHHRMLRSYEPGEEWFYDWATEGMWQSGPRLAPLEHHPLSQPVPGPEGRVPADWQEHLHT